MRQNFKRKIAKREVAKFNVKEEQENTNGF